MKKLLIIVMALVALASCKKEEKAEERLQLYTPEIEDFDYIVDRFADLQILRYRVVGIENLSLQQQELLYYLSEAALCGRDIIYDQNGKYNLAIRTLLESVYTMEGIDTTSADFKAMEVYLKRVWVSNGIHHHYSGVKFEPGFTQAWFEEQINKLPFEKLPLKEGQSKDELFAELLPVIFDPTVMPTHKNQIDGEDVIVTSASNYYGDGEEFYNKMREADPNKETPISYGLNSQLVLRDGQLVEDVYKVGGKYDAAMSKIVYWLEKALNVCETEAQRAALAKMIEFYKTGDLKTFDDYAILWIADTESLIDYVCGYTETYGDPLGTKAAWEAVINFKNVEATKRTTKISDNAQWFEDNSPVDPQFKKEECKGVTAKVITAAMMGGDNYPTSALGINLPNADWIRAAHGSKSVTIDNIAEAYAQSVKSSGFNDEFCIGKEEVELLKKYKDVTDNLHTDLHECLGHGSGQLLPGTPANALKEFTSCLEEARADLFALYYLADPKLVELGLLDSPEAYKAAYISQIRNGIFTQFCRIELGKQNTEAHMQDRKLIAQWCYEKGLPGNVIEKKVRDGKTYFVINEYEALRGLFGDLLAEIQRIKSEGDYEAGKALVEDYAIQIDYDLHKEVLERYSSLDLKPYRGFINPDIVPVEKDGKVVDYKVVYCEDFLEQQLKYGEEYRTL